MIIKDITTEIELTPSEIAHEIWDMHDFEQVDLLEALANVADYSKILVQINSVKDMLSIMRPDIKQKVKQFVSDLYEYICEE